MKRSLVASVWTILAAVFVSGCSETQYNSLEEIAFELSETGVDCSELEFYGEPNSYGWANDAGDEAGIISSGACSSEGPNGIEIFVFANSSNVDDFLCGEAIRLGSSELLVGENWVVQESTSRFTPKILKETLGGKITTAGEVCGK